MFLIGFLGNSSNHWKSYFQLTPCEDFVKKHEEKLLLRFQHLENLHQKQQNVPPLPPLADVPLWFLICSTSLDVSSLISTRQIVFLSVFSAVLHLCEKWWMGLKSLRCSEILVRRHSFSFSAVSFLFWGQTESSWAPPCTEGKNLHFFHLFCFKSVQFYPHFTT